MILKCYLYETCDDMSGQFSNNRHYTLSRTTIMDFSTVIIVGPAYDHLYDTSTGTGIDWAVSWILVLS